MSQEYKYAGEPLSEIAALDDLKKRYTPDTALATGHSLNNLRYTTEEQHVKNGGLPTDDSEALAAILQRVRYYLLRSGHATELLGGKLILPKNGQRILGNGSEWVYCYYINSQKAEGDPRYPCTIGLTRSDGIKSVTEYIEKQMRKAIVERPKIPLLFRTDGCVDLEGAIHRVLRLRGQQIDAPGNELFYTNPKEVLQIYDFIVHGDSHYTTTQEREDIHRAERARERLLKPQSKAEKYRSYFQSLIDGLREEHAFTNARVAIPQNWYQFASGRTGIGYGTWFKKGSRTCAYLSINQTWFKSDRIKFFDTLAASKKEISTHFDIPLQWERNTEGKISYIIVYRDGDIEASASELADIRDWHVKYLLRFKAVFQPLINGYRMAPRQDRPFENG